MLKTIHVRLSVLALCLMLLFQAGCALTSKSSRFYVLSSMAGLDMGEKPTANADSISISIGPVSLPKYLKKTQIVTRTGSNELQLAEFDLWAGRIEEDIGRVVAENLAYLLSNDRVLSYPAIDAVESDYTIEMDVSRFDGSLGGYIELIVRWAIFDVRGDIVKGIALTHIKEQVQGSGYAGLVAAQSLALVSFSRDLADGIIDLAGR